MEFHYVYRITNTLTNKHYYGVRSSKLLPLEDLGIKYFSSSLDDEFINDQKENAKNYKYKIIKVFSSRDDAVTLEIRLHKKFSVATNPMFYNRSCQTATGFDTSGIKFPGRVSNNKGKKMSEEQKKKISNSLKGKTHTKERRKNISEGLKGNIPWNKGKQMSDGFKEKCSNRVPAMLGKTHSEKAKNNMSEAAKNLPLKTCPHCGKQSRSNSIKRWHFDNCKLKEVK